MKKFILLVFLFICSNTFPQEINPVKATSSKVRLKGFEKRKSQQKNSLLKNVAFRSVGPTVMSGRVTDIDASPRDPAVFYVAYASGGLWKTTNSGISFQSLFDNEASMTIGDIVIDWENNIIYVGTGEKNSSRSSYSGTGIYKSTDDGNTWIHLGLEETHRIGRIIIDPLDKNNIWIAALGHLYSPNPDRGVYKSTDGGETWRKTLFVDENTGAIDIVLNPLNPREIYASTWYRTRRAWDFVESGSTSGIYKSKDGGETWYLQSTPESGFPSGEGVGRIGLSIYPPDPDIIYAFLDNQGQREKKEETGFILTKEILRNMERDEFLNLKDSLVNDFLDRFNFPDKYNSQGIKQKVESGDIQPENLVDYLEDANSLLLDTPVIGAEIYVSSDGGASWKKTHEDYLDNTVNSYGYYFGEIRVDPLNKDKIYILGVPLLNSDDGGKTFKSIDRENVHGDHQALWINPLKTNHLILGNDGGINISYDGGKNWFKANTLPVGQFYSVAVDKTEPYNIFGGLQDNGVWMGPSNYKYSMHWYQIGHYPYKRILGGDGMQVAVDTRDNNIVYAGYQFGNYYRIDISTGENKHIQPRHELGEKPFRFNWMTPIHLSLHNQDILYLGSNKVHRSLDKGDNFDVISDDLTKGGKKGDVPYGTLTSIDESDLQFGLLFAGSDDGYIHVTTDGGGSWNRISDNLPQNYWVSRVEASKFDRNTVYVSLNGYRWDNFESLIFRSTNLGDSWERLGLNLPAEPVNVFREDPVNRNVLYVGTDNGIYISLNEGAEFMELGKGLPAAPVHDLVIHPRENQMVLATHGRSLYIADMSIVQQLNIDIINTALYLFNIDEITHSNQWGERNSKWSEPYEPVTEIAYWSAVPDSITFRVKISDNITLKEKKYSCDRGLNFIQYNNDIDSTNISALLSTGKIKKKDNGQYFLPPGEFIVELQRDDKKETKMLKINPKKIKKRGT